MKILVVEDNEDSRILLESLLEANGYEVESAENGIVAFELATRRPPDLIISDILMPEMDGYVLCRAVKADEQLRAIPFVFYTATYISPSIKNVLGYSQEEVKVHFTEYHTDSTINNDVVGCTEQSIKGVKLPPYEVEVYHQTKG
jgi:CheY-like chemotaxis protein